MEKIQYNDEYDNQLRQLVLENKYGYYGKLQKCKELKYLDDYIFKCTYFLTETELHIGKKFANRAVRVFYTLNHIDHQLECCVCHKPYVISKYFSITEKCNIDIKHLHCCHKCAMNDPQTQQHITDTFILHYGVKSCFQAESVKQKIYNTNEKRYGTGKFSQSEKFLEIGKSNNWWPETNEQRKQRGKVLKEVLAKKTPEEKLESHKKAVLTNRKRYGVDNYSQSSLSKDKYKDKKWVNAKKAKEINTKIKNGTINTSKLEENSYIILCEKFGKEQIIRQYRDDRYPFACDFYIKDLDMFIECNFHWTHGGCIFNPLNQDHINKVNKLKSYNTKFYDTAIKVWTERDPLKLKIANDNKLNYYAFYTLNDLKLWINQFNESK